MDNVIELAMRRRAALQAEIAKLDEFIAMARALTDPDEKKGFMEGAARLAVAHEASKKSRALGACRDAIELAGPQSLTELYVHLRGLDIDPGSKNPKGMLSIMLNRSEEFVSEGGKWSLKQHAPSGG